MARLLYSLLLWLLLPYALLHLFLRGRRQPEYLAHVAERFGRYSGPRCARPLIWLHAVSVGETRAAQTLIKALQQRYPDHGIVISHMTPTGRQTSTELFGDQVQRVYLPYDYGFAVRGFLDHFRPVLGIVMETELWPNLSAACRRRGIPLLLANARLSQKSARNYQRFARLTRDMLTSLAAIAAQTQADAERLSQLGARDVAVLGNVKFDILPPADQATKSAALRQLMGQRPVLLAASTREGEEALILDALLRSPWPDAQVLLVIVPRHPQRFDAVAQLITERGFTLQRRSSGAAVARTTQVWLGDSMGELFAYYGAADLTYVGGSLLPLGGQNLIEPCAVGTPVMVGPHTFNFLEATEQAIAGGAALRVADADALLKTGRQLLADPAGRQAMADAGLAFTARHRGATARTMALVTRFLPQ